jgi:hypothetical protein
MTVHKLKRLEQPRAMRLVMPGGVAKANGGLQLQFHVVNGCHFFKVGLVSPGDVWEMSQIPGSWFSWVL